MTVVHRITIRGWSPERSAPNPFGRVLLSWQAVTWVLEQSDSELGSRLVLLAIASHANREGKCAFPTVATLSLEARLSEREVRYCIQALEERGELRIQRGIGRGNPSRYELPHVLPWLEAVNNKYQKGAKSAPLHKGKGAYDSVKGAISDTKRCNRLELSHTESNTSIQQPLEPSKQITVKPEIPKYLCSLKPSKAPSRSELRQRLDGQLAALRAKGYIA